MKWKVEIVNRPGNIADVFKKIEITLDGILFGRFDWNYFHQSTQEDICKLLEMLLNDAIKVVTDKKSVEIIEKINQKPDEKIVPLIGCI